MSTSSGNKISKATIVEKCSTITASTAGEKFFCPFHCLLIGVYFALKKPQDCSPEPEEWHVDHAAPGAGPVYRPAFRLRRLVETETGFCHTTLLCGSSAGAIISSAHLMISFDMLSPKSALLPESQIKLPVRSFGFVPGQSSAPRAPWQSKRPWQRQRSLPGGTRPCSSPPALASSPSPATPPCASAALGIPVPARQNRTLECREFCNIKICTAEVRGTYQSLEVHVMLVDLGHDVERRVVGDEAAVQEAPHRPEVGRGGAAGPRSAPHARVCGKERAAAETGPDSLLSVAPPCSARVTPMNNTVVCVD